MFNACNCRAHVDMINQSYSSAQFPARQAFWKMFSNLGRDIGTWWSMGHLMASCKCALNFANQNWWRRSLRLSDLCMQRQCSRWSIWCQLDINIISRPESSIVLMIIELDALQSKPSLPDLASAYPGNCSPSSGSSPTLATVVLEKHCQSLLNLIVWAVSILPLISDLNELNQNEHHSADPISIQIMSVVYGHLHLPYCASPENLSKIWSDMAMLVWRWQFSKLLKLH